MSDIYETVLEYIKGLVECKNDLDPEYLVSKGTNNGFEKLIIYVLENEFDHAKFPNNTIEFIPRFGNHFPDIDVRVDGCLYGMELKSSQQNSWKVNGGSVFEGNSEYYEDIYVFFGSRRKVQKNYKIKYRPYWQVADGVQVTHSPRYSLNMDAKYSDLFYQSKEEYVRIRSSQESEKIEFFREKLRTSVTKPTWYTSTSNQNPEIEPNRFKNLSIQDRGKIISEILIFYPQDFLKTGNCNYDNAIKYMMGNYFVFSPSMRDIFTAGGTYKYRNRTIPKIIKTFEMNIENILKILHTADSDFKNAVHESWKNINGFEFDRNESLEVSYEQLIVYLGDNQLNNMTGVELKKLIYKR